MRNFHVFFVIVLFTLGCKVQQKEIEKASHSIEWASDREGIRAGAIMVPENHDEPEGRKIKISYLVVEARDTTSTKYPMVFFSGGPGGNTIDAGLVDFLLQNPISVKRDIVLFDQRGIGYSSALPDMALAAFDIMAKDADEAGELELTRNMIEEYQKKCADLNIQTQYYNTHQNARDVGMLFEHLGYEKYNLFGGSYGTRVARVVQDLFPEYIHSSILDSPDPISGDLLLDRLESYSLALSRIFGYCSKTPECKYEYPELQDEYFNAIEKLREEPLAVEMNDSTTVHINAQDGIYLLRRLLYQGHAREKTPEMIRAFNEGGGPIVNNTLQFEYDLSTGMNLTMFLAVEKLEQYNTANTSDVIDGWYEKYPLIPVKLGFFDAFYRAGMDWHEDELPVGERKFKKSDIPTLIFVNRYDPVTPPVNGHIFMEDLSQGTLLILDEGGHGQGNPKCKNKVMIAFMNNPEAAVNTSCLNIYEETN